jgi:hypothetical protein
MATFYLTLHVVPKKTNPRINDIEGALASCWVCGYSPQSALAKASFGVRQYDWDIVEIKNPPTEVGLESFIGKDIGLEQYEVAQKTGIAIVFAAWSRDGKSSYGPVRLERSYKLDLAPFLAGIKKLKRKGRCLHYDAGDACSRLINAHSIQKNGALSLIAENGHVYAISRNCGDVKDDGGELTYTKQGINTVSTFRGFCEKHDGQMFEPIDATPLVPTQQQIFLYAYRVLCRELLIKENALTLLESQAENNRGQAALYELFNNMRRGTELGLNNLLSQKRKYDEALRMQSFSEIKSVLFCTEQKPSAVFSGAIYPDFDFLGRPLQDLSDHSTTFDLLTFSFVPMDQGWGVLFAWQSESSGTCVPFMRSLATRIHEDENAGDHIFRLVVLNCENIAMRPQWWESLPKRARIAIKKSASSGTDVFEPVRRDYLTGGLENISGWKFESVISDMD